MTNNPTPTDFQRFCFRHPQWMAERLEALAEAKALELADLRRLLVVDAAEGMVNGSAPSVDLKVFPKPGRPPAAKFDIRGGELAIVKTEKNPGRISISLTGSIEDVNWDEVVQNFKAQEKKQSTQVSWVILDPEKDAKVIGHLETLRLRREEDSQLIRRVLYTGLVMHEENERITSTKKSLS